MSKLKLLYVLFLLFFISVVIKLAYVQMVRPTSQSDSGYLKTRKIVPERGRMYDRNGQPLVINKEMFRMYAEPKKIEEPYSFVKKLAPILNLDEASLSSRLDKTKDWVSIKNSIDKETKSKLLSMGLKGIGFDEEWQRYYPEASLAAHVIGFVGKKESGEDIGYFGLEGYYDKDLGGLPGLLKTERDLMGKLILIGTQERLEPENGRDLYLTIDKAVQELVKTKLKKGLETYKAKEGCIIVANPQNLEILALSCLPDFDQGQYYSFTENYFKNSAISSLYEPGSIFKPLIMAAAIEEKSIQPDEIYDETGSIQIGEYRIKTWNDKYEGKISMTRILEKSSNVGMVYVGQKLGEEKIFSYLKKYGFGESTGIDLQGEVGGYLKLRQNWYPIDFATVTFGQGIAVTPIQMVKAFASLVNGGKIMTPRIVGKIKSEERDQIIETKRNQTVIHERTSEIIKKMLFSTVENGEIRWARPRGYQIGGKTGTAQIPIKGYYDPTKTIASFIGFAPVSSPRFLTLVILKEPQTSVWGSETAAPLFFEVAKELLIYYNIAPEQ